MPKKIDKYGLIGMMMLFCIFSTGMSYGQSANYDTNSKIKALFIHSFTKYIEWPMTTEDGVFTIGVYGEYPSLVAELKTMAAKKSTATTKFEIVNYFRASQIQDCEILFVAHDDVDAIPSIFSSLKTYPTLLITDYEIDTDKGAGINFYYQSGKQKMEIYKSNVESRNLHLSSNLLSLAKVVN